VIKRKPIAGLAGEQRAAEAASHNCAAIRGIRPVDQRAIIASSCELLRVTVSVAELLRMPAAFGRLRWRAKRACMRSSLCVPCSSAFFAIGFVVQA
jgi:hypothetical protein